MKLRKAINKIGLASGTLAMIITGAAAFSAFEAHIVNVTATIENALTVPVEASGLTFGTVFPEEVLHQNLPISLSGSFLAEDRVDDVEYMIRQKPKCGIPIPNTSPVQYSGFAQVAHGPDGTFVCPLVTVTDSVEQVQSVELPLLCPFLSKHEMTTDGTEQENDGAGIDAFHGPLTGWDQADSVGTQVLGRLVKAAGDTSDEWDIDLHVPAFEGQVAQDGVIPLDYLLDPAVEHQVFGCDLWVEVTEISLPGNGETANLTVIKHVDNTSGTASSVASDFTINVSGGGTPSSFPGSEAGTLVTMSAPGSYSVTEPAVAGYTTTYSADCTGTVVANDSKVCTVTNTANPTQVTTTLNVIKHVVGGTAVAGDFTMNVTATNPTPSSFPGSEAGTLVTLDPGAYEVTETGPAGYTATTDCLGTIAAGEHLTCTVTNNLDQGTLTVVKVVENNGVGTHVAGDFQMQIDGSNVNQNTATSVTPGNHTVSEVDAFGYTATFSASCPGGVANVPNGGNVTCTVTNSASFGTITVTKVVTNNNGGNAVIPNFSLFVGSTNVLSGAPNHFAPGTYLISESGVGGYAATFAGDCDPQSQELTVAAGGSATCTITNDDIAPNITLNKVVINDNGGTAVATDFIMRIDGGAPVPTGSSRLVTANAAHTITEDAKTGYHFVSLTGSAKCPAVLGGTATLDEGEAISCTITNSDNGGAQ